MKLFPLCKYVLVTLVILLPMQSKSYENPQSRYLYHPPETNGDIRYNYHWEILQAALNVTVDTFGPYDLSPTIPMNEDRQIQEIRRNTGLLTVMIRETSEENENTLLPVRIPIDRNLLSYRVFLINQKDSGIFAAVTSLDDLKKIPLGQGKGWGDVDILQAAGFTVVTELYYDKIFKRLMAGNFTGFPRGVTEVQAEFEQRKHSMKDLMIEKTLLLYYPLPTYFWFPKDAVGKKLSERVENGMNILINNGEYEKIFHKYHDSVIASLHLKDRKIFKIDNPFLPKTTPFADTRLWFDPTQ